MNSSVYPLNYVRFDYFIITMLVLILNFDCCSLNDNMWDDGNSLGPKEVHNYLTRVMYNRRNKFDPLLNSLVLGGVKNGQKYLGVVGIGFSFLLCSTMSSLKSASLFGCCAYESYPGQQHWN